jgi:hypothetical protein
MKLNTFACLLILAGLTLTGCASVFQVQVNGYTDPEAPAAIAPGSSFFIIENQQAKNPLLEKEIKEKIGKLLTMQGYQLVAYDRAQYYLFFSYGIGQERSAAVLMPDYSYGFGIGTGTGFRGGSYFFAAPFFSFYPYPENLYDRWLLLNVVDGQYYREKQEFRTLWVGEARSTGTSADLRMAVNYLLVADFMNFGLNTGKAQVVEIPEQDPRIRQIEK